jgi:hypothetical protein
VDLVKAVKEVLSGYEIKAKLPWYFSVPIYSVEEAS